MALVPISIERSSRPPLGIPLRSDGHWGVNNNLRYVMLTSGRSIVNSVNNKIRALHANVTATPEGFANLAAGQVANTSIENTIASQNQTIIIQFSGNTSALGSIPALDASINSGSSSRRLLGEWRASSSECGLSVGFGNNGVFVYGWGSADWHVVARYAGTVPEKGTLTIRLSGGVPYIYLDNVAVGTSSSSKSGKTWYTPSAVFSDNISNDYSAVAEIRSIAIYASLLSLPECRSLSANPWQIYEPEVVWVEVGGSVGGDITGTSSQTLADLVQSCGGTVLVSGSGASLLAAVSQISAGSVLVAGGQSSALAGLTQTSAGSVLISGLGAQTLGQLTGTAAGTVAIIGSQSAVLEALSQVGAGYIGTPPVIGLQSATLANLTGNGAGTVTISAAQVSQLASLAQSSSGLVMIQGQQSAVLAAITQVSHGHVGDEVVVVLHRGGILPPRIRGGILSARSRGGFA